VSVLRLTVAFGVLVYLGLWALAIAKAHGLIPVLILPLVLGLLVAGGNWFSQFMGMPARSPKFKRPDDEP
jgi:hypothetical protein